MRAVIAIALLTAGFVPTVCMAQQYDFTSPGAKAVEAIERTQLCQSIVRAGGECPPASTPIDDVRAYYRRLVDAKSAALRAQQQRAMEQAGLEQRIRNALAAALQLQASEFRQMFETLQQELDALRLPSSDGTNGWILWSEESRITPRTEKRVAEDERWGLMGGFETWQGCQNALTQRKERDFTPTTTMALLKLGWTADYYCFPSGFNPRPRP